MGKPSNDWIEDCMHWRGKILTGKYAHWCQEWDDLPVDETCSEFSCCSCYKETQEIENIKEKLIMGTYDRKALHSIAKKFKETMGCNCDLDNWQPEESTGHSHVCRIHKATMEVARTKRIDPRVDLSKIL